MKNKFGSKSRLLIKCIDYLTYEIKTKNIYDGFSKNKEMFKFSNYSTKPKYYDDSNELVVCKMKLKMGSVAIEELVGLTPKMYLTIISISREYKKAKPGRNCCC